MPLPNGTTEQDINDACEWDDPTDDRPCPACAGARVPIDGLPWCEYCSFDGVGLPDEA